AFSAEPASAITWAPAARTSCTAADPTPPAAAWISTVSPGCTPARRNSDRAARWKGMRTAAAPGSGTDSGMGKVMVAGAQQRPVDAVADRGRGAQDLHARYVGGGDRHRSIAPVDAVDVVEVQGDRVDPDLHLPWFRRGLVDLVETQDVARRAVLDRSPGAHRPLRRRARARVGGWRAPARCSSR